MADTQEPQHGQESQQGQEPQQGQESQQGQEPQQEQGGRRERAPHAGAGREEGLHEGRGFQQPQGVQDSAFEQPRGLFEQPHGPFEQPQGLFEPQAPRPGRASLPGDDVLGRRDQPAGELPLFYRNPEPLHPQRHGKLGLRRDFGFGFARGINVVPINVVEFPQVCHFYPIAFAPGAASTPIAILGLRRTENLFVDENGDWLPDTYIPSYVRRYPFVFSEIPGGEQLTLCVDVTEETVEEREDERFFNEDDSPSELLKSALEFCKSFQQAMLQTAPFYNALTESGVLVDRQVNINLDEQNQITFGGFRIVDEQALREIPDERFLEWRRQGWLPLIYAHLFSARQFDRLIRLMRGRLARDAESARPAASEEG